MHPTEKAIKYTAAVLHCIPVVNTVASCSLALYKLAIRVDVLRPGSSGIRISLTIHVLSKGSLEFLIEALPLIGNLVALVKLATALVCGFEADLEKAISEDNAELLDLCLQRHPLSEEDPARALSLLVRSAGRSREVFRLVLHSRYPWSSHDLLSSLLRLRSDNRENGDDILDYWGEKGLAINQEGYYSAYLAAKNFLEAGEGDFAERIIREIFPEKIPLKDITHLLFSYSCPQYDFEENVLPKVVFTEEQRERLLKKAESFSLHDIENYYFMVFSQLIGENRLSEDYRDIHFYLLGRLLREAQCSVDEMSRFILKVGKTRELNFFGRLIEVYEHELSAGAKLEILKELIPSYSDQMSCCKEKKNLFYHWMIRWKIDPNLDLRVLIQAISESKERQIEAAERLAGVHPELKGQFPDAQILRQIYEELKGALSVEPAEVFYEL